MRICFVHVGFYWCCSYIRKGSSSTANSENADLKGCPDKSHMMFSTTSATEACLQALLVIKNNKHLKLDISASFALLGACGNRHNFIRL